MFVEALESYNIYVFTPKKDQDWTDDIKQEHKRQSDNAMKLFRGLFCGRDVFKSAKAAKEWLDKNKKTTSTVINTLAEWTLEELAKLKSYGAEYRHYFETDTVEEYSEAVEPLLFGSSQLDEPSLWPLVRSVRYKSATFNC